MTVPNALKCFNSGECHICKPGDPISTDTNFDCPNVAMLVPTSINGGSTTFCMRTTNTKGLTSNGLRSYIPLNPAVSAVNPNSMSMSDISNGCLIAPEGTREIYPDYKGIMQACKETMKTDLVMYNVCQACSKQFHTNIYSCMQCTI